MIELTMVTESGEPFDLSELDSFSVGYRDSDGVDKVVESIECEIDIAVITNIERFKYLSGIGDTPIEALSILLDAIGICEEMVE